MRRKLVAALLVLALLSVGVLGVSAFDDTQGHWANENIERAVSLGLFRGVSDTEFDPNAPMTRAMFVTVLGRMAGVDPAEWQCDYLPLLFSDVDTGSYYAPYVAWAVHMGITGGTGSGKFSPNDYVTREQMARFIANYLTASNSTLQVYAPQMTDDAGDAPAPDETAQTAETVAPLHPYDAEQHPDVFAFRDAAAQPEPTLQFSDAAEISAWAVDSVALLSGYRLLSGMSDGNGGFRFAPKNNATRAECATLFCRLIDSIVPPETAPVLPTMLVINQSNLQLEYGESCALVATVFPLDADNDHVLWFSTEPEIAAVDANGLVTGVGPGMAFVYAVSCNGHISVCEIYVNDPPTPEIDPTPPAAGLGSAGMSDHDKDMMIFGYDVSDPRTVYLETGRDDAVAHMQTISIRVWDLAADGSKYTRTFYLQVHQNLVPTVQAIFEEIYNLPEKPVIHTIGGWRWDGRSEHTCGTAIDINFMENPFLDANGNVLVGGAYRPGEDPYSIPVDGSIDRIFNKYGFTRGIYWRNGTKDYMHYSFYGT